VAALLAADHPELVAGLALSGVRRQVPRGAAMLQTTIFRAVRSGSLGRGQPAPAPALAQEKRNLIEATRELGRVDLRPVLPRIAAPTIVFAPERDRFVRGDVPHVAAAIPDAEIIPIPGAGHLWIQDQPELFARSVITGLVRAPCQDG
jgi:pimeloyl-ACP methyl ester carboxylesterase